jgi:hypothetical protein
MLAAYHVFISFHFCADPDPSKMKEEQDKLEKRLWEEREDIRRSHEEKVKVAKNKYAQCPPSPQPSYVPIPTVLLAGQS